MRIGPVYWLEEALAEDPGAACPPLTGTVRADVCVVGGGFTGLWTALEVAEQAPDATIVLLEAQGCGFGALGRNGGWATGWHDELHDLVERFGAEQAVFLAEQSTRAIDRIEQVANEAGIDCQLRRAGAICAAAAPAQVGAIAPVLKTARAHGREAFFEPLDGDELRRRTGSPVLLEGLRHVDAAAIQPALLARGLRRLALRRAIVPVGSHIVLTEPIPDRIAALGWSGGELLGDTRLLVHYAQVTREGRIAFGRGGGAIGSFGRVRRRTSSTRDGGDRHRRPAALVPAARRRAPDARLGGAVDRAPGHLPFVGELGRHGNVHYGVGFSGNGVAPSAFVGRILGRRAHGIRDELTTCALVSGPPGYLPPEPVRSLGGVLIRDAVQQAEAAEENGATAGPLTRALRRLLWFTMPRALEPRLWRSGRLRKGA